MLAREISFLRIKLKEGFIIPNVPIKYTIIRYQVNDILSPDFITEMFDSNLELREVQLFISPPLTVGKIHVDGHELGLDIAAFNYVINNNSDWKMQWFDADTNNLNKLVSNGNTDYISLESTQCKLIYEFKTLSPFIVQVGVPHRIVNFSNMPRYCLSLRFKQNDFKTVLKNANRYYSEI